MIKLYLEDRIRDSNQAMIARQNKNLRYERRIYKEVLSMLRDFKANG
jgi:hypothetical protein